MYRCEHPKPQFQRDAWINLNGEWQFEIDRGNSGVARKLYEDAAVLGSKINVPFCPQCKLSGVEDKDFMTSVWYKKTVELTEEQVSGIVYLHFGAVDYLSTVFINGKRAGKHKGGYVSFKVDVTEFVHAGTNTTTKGILMMIYIFGNKIRATACKANTDFRNGNDGSESTYILFFNRSYHFGLNIAITIYIIISHI